MVGQGKIKLDSTFQNGVRIHWSNPSPEDYLDSLSIEYDGDIVFTQVEYIIYLGLHQVNDISSSSMDSIFSDFNNNKVADLIIGVSGGGNSGARTLNILEFGPKKSETLLKNKEIIGGEIFAHNDDAVFSHFDNVFAYWNTCGSCSPYFRIFETWSEVDKEFRFSKPINDHLTYRYKNKNRTIDYFVDNFHTVVADVLHRDEWCSATNVDDQRETYSIGQLYNYWGIISLFLNAGMMEEANNFSKLAWNDTEASRIGFLKSYIRQLQTSRNYTYLKSIIPDLDSLLD